MTQYGSFQAKTHLPELLERASKGEKILITKRGKPVAMLVPPPPVAEKDVRQVVKEMLAYRDRVGRTLDGLSIQTMREEGRRG